MASRTEEIGDALDALITVLGEHRSQAARAADSAGARSASSFEHGWDGVASTYESAREHLEEARGELQTAQEGVGTARQVLSGIPDDPSTSEVAEHLARMAVELDGVGTAVEGAMGRMDEARGYAEAAAGEWLVGVLDDLLEEMRATGEALGSVGSEVGDEILVLGSAQAGDGKAPGDGVAARIEELRRYGHAYQRHGPGVTQAQLADRALWGIDPMTGTTIDGESGRKHRCGRDATKLTSDEAFVKAEKYLRRSQSFETQRRENEISGDARIDVVAPLASIFGAAYRQHVQGVQRQGTKTQPTGDPPGSHPPALSDLTDGAMFALFVRDTDGVYRLRTMYPQPKD